MQEVCKPRRLISLQSLCLVTVKRVQVRVFWSARTIESVESCAPVMPQSDDAAILCVEILSVSPFQLLPLENQSGLKTSRCDAEPQRLNSLVLDEVVLLVPGVSLSFDLI